MSSDPMESVISHWYQLFEEFRTSSLDFYSDVEKAIRRREVPDVSTTRIELKEGGAFTAKREYLRVTRRRHAFDICAAPFGTGFFFSSWLTETPARSGPLIAILVALGCLLSWGVLADQFGFLEGSFLWLVLVALTFWVVGYFVRKGTWDIEDALLEVPGLGALYDRLFKPATYYRLDTALMFQQSIHNAVMEVIDGLRKTKGLRMLTDMERKPIMRDFATKK
jgi:hypothetical protein